MDENQRNDALQALNLLDQVVSTIGSRQLAEGGRAAHVQYQQAVTAIREALVPAPETKPKPKKKGMA